VRLVLTVLWDIVISNVQVAWLILGPERRIQPRFVWLPLEIRDPHGIASLAGIITMTPGTLSADLTEDRRFLLVHALNVSDEAALIASIKARYESPLRRVFGEER
jgi:multicomponent K+:H+ antiporter subunit E